MLLAVHYVANLDALFAYIRVFRPLLVPLMHMRAYSLRPHRVNQLRKKPSRENKLGWRPR